MQAKLTNDGLAILGPHAVLGCNAYTLLTPHPFPSSIPTGGLTFSMHERLFTPDCIKFHVVDRSTPYTILLPKYYPFNSPLFERLDYDRTNLPLVQDPSTLMWGMKKELCEEWIYLEKMLRAVIVEMHNLCPTYLTPFLEYFAPPESTGYHQPSRSRAEMVRKMILACDSFIPLTAAVAYGFTALIVMENNLNKQFDWRSRLAWQTKIQPQWLADLERSAITDTAVPRVGGVIDANHVEPRLLDFLTYFNAPLVVNWGPLDSAGEVHIPHVVRSALAQRNLVPPTTLLLTLATAARTRSWARTTITLPLKPLPFTTGRGVPITSFASSGPASPISFSSNASSMSEGQSIFTAPPPPPSSASSAPVTTTPRGPILYPLPDYNSDSSADFNENTHPAEFPRVYAHSGQRQDETLQDFFARREKRREEMAAAETDLDRGRRINRTATNSLFGKKGGPKVYQWRNRNGFWLRKPVQKSRREEVYHQNTSAARYDPWHNEWDICALFAPPRPSAVEVVPYGALPEHDLLDEFGNEVPMISNLLPTRAPPSTSFHSTDIYPSPDVLQDSLHPKSDLDSAHNFPASYKILAVSSQDLPALSAVDLHRRYGYPEPDEHVEMLFDDALTRARRIYGFMIPPDLKQSCSIPLSLKARQLLGCTWQSETYSSPCRENAALNMWVEKIGGNKDLKKSLYGTLDLSNNVTHFQRFKVCITSYDDQPHYFLSSATGYRSQIQIVLYNARAVLDLLRSNTPAELDDAVAYLVGKGIRFNTMIANKRRPIKDNQANKPQALSRLGFRPAGYQPTEGDYCAYETLRQEFLESPRGRAAVLAGGIVARLVRQHVSLDVVLAGPSDEVYANGLCLWDGDADSFSYWDDQLTIEERYLVCGVYNTYVGEERVGKMISFWPRPRDWCLSGLSSHWWTSDAESWFTRHEEDLRDDLYPAKRALRTEKEWRSRIRFYHCVDYSHTRLEKLSHRLISDILAQ